ncbi:peptidase M23 [Rhodospirillum rubrum]|nr:peptidase M23 [Rhodospirillum rubrum]MBK1675632.1 peptidase M23 [Rhodospirillum rubrum]
MSAPLPPLMPWRPIVGADQHPYSGPMTSSAQNMSRPSPRLPSIRAAALTVALGLAVASCGGGSSDFGPTPDSERQARSYTVAQGDTVYAVSRRFGIPVPAIIKENALSPPFILHIGQVLRLPGQKIHTVARGDTLYSIAKRYSIDMNRLARLNAIDDTNLIKVGQALSIPGEEAPPSDGDEALAATSIPVARESLPPPSAYPGALAYPGTAAYPGSQTAQAAPPPNPHAAPASVWVAPGAAPSPAQGANGFSPAQGANGFSPAQGATASSPPQGATGILRPPQSTAPPLTTQPPAPMAAPAPVSPTPATAHGPVPMPPERSGAFAWPVRGTVLSRFGATPKGQHNDGINIAAPRGTSVTAAETGVVAYAGNEIRGFGNLLLIKHEGGFMTAYAHNDALLVKRGETVSRGQTIARVGSSGGVGAPQIHFEIRRNGKPIDPTPYLTGQKVASR